ncbi:LytTR family transcriptional regulator [Fulvivirga sp. RKSG066]|uniref:LytR/AlgR family response regulator transcription factor n=1 Tax=Fulvivirga aurantia TaxID=2529383 RepID=UPI0012BB62F9|nr:LytTR family DNA-binding domain-containing protein [Fulvivirga aurantia]MTI23104.1 LytTR family transcriptional regulator [Fulvivirga aurantia]
MKPLYLFKSRIATHVAFWIVYYIAFSLIWAKDQDYLASFFLEFILLPVRIMAVYVTIYVLIPKLLTKSSWVRFLLGYVSLIAVCGVVQRLISYYFYEGIFIETGAPLFDSSSYLRAIILINTTVVFVAAIKITQLLFTEKDRVKYLEKLLEDRPDTYVEVRSDKRIHRVEADSILYVEGLGNYVRFVLKDKKLISYSSMRDVEQTLPDNFLRVHKSFIINKNHISSYNHEDIQVDDQFIPIGRSYKNAVNI